MNAAELFLSIYYPACIVALSVVVWRMRRKQRVEPSPFCVRLYHKWQPWPDRPGWQFCPDCSACREVAA